LTAPAGSTTMPRRSRRAGFTQDVLSSKDHPERREPAIEVTAALEPVVPVDRSVPVLALPGFTLFPGTLVPLHAFEPEACRLLAESLADRRLLVLAALDAPGPERSLHPVAGLGRIVSDRRYPDGRVDAFVHGLARVRLKSVALGPWGLVAEVETLADMPMRSPALPGLRLLSVALALERALLGTRSEEAEALRSLIRSSDDPAVLADRVAAAFVEPFAERQALLAERCPASRCDAVAARLGELLLGVAPPPRGPLH
jgi:Lon protease-like protein